MAVATVVFAFLDSGTRVPEEGGDVSELLLNAGFPLFTLAAILAMASIVVRFRRSSGVERQQVKWMAAASALVVVAGS